MIPYMINNGIHEIMDKVDKDVDNKLTYATLVYYKDRIMCEIDRMYKYEHMSNSEPAQQIDIRRKINDMGHIVDRIDEKLAAMSKDNSSKSMGMQFSKLTAILKTLD